MALSLTPSFVEKINSVLPLAQSATGLSVRVVSQGSDTIGTLTTTGVLGTATWTIEGAAPSWISITLDSTNTICTISFSGAQYQQNPYEFFISVTDGVTTANFPIYLEVRSPFYIAANTTNPVVVNATTLNVSSYDNTVADILIQGYGLYGAIQPNCNFILPNILSDFAGLDYVTSDESSLKLRVTEAHFGNSPFTATDLIGGLKLYTTSPVALPLTIEAYQPGSFYDNPDRTYSLTMSVGSQLQKAGVLDFGAGVYYDTVHSLLSVNAQIDVLLGNLQSQGNPVSLPLQYNWSSTGPLTINSGGNTSGSTTNKNATYTISSTASGATVSLQIADSTGVPVLNGLKIFTLNEVAQTGTSWLSTAAIKVGVDANYKIGYTGSPITLTLSSPDGFNASETIYFTVNIEDESSIESGLSTPTLTPNTGITISSGSPTATLTFQFPTGAAIGNKWVVKVAAANAASSPTRQGYAQVLIECSGKPPLTITGVSTTINSSTGASITPIQLATTDSLSNPVSSTFELVGGTAFGSGVNGAPDGVFINTQGQISGNATVAGVYKFVVAATATGYQRSYSSVITMTVTQVYTPLQITTPTSSAASIPDNTSFTVSWGVSGNPTALFLAQIPSSTPVRTVTGSGSTTVQQVGSTVYSIYGTSYYGTAYSVPLVVISSSIAAASNLLPAPTIATIDETYELTANWQPYPVSGVYTAYKGWNITLTTPPGSGTPVTIFDDGLENGGTNSARVFMEQLNAGDYSMNMTAVSSNYTVALNSNPWDTSHTFPTALLSANVSFDNTNILLGQTLNITLNANYAGATAWQVVFPDNTSTGWLPLTTRSIAKSFTSSGAQNIIIQTQNDFGTANPPVKLRRQFTQQIYVVDQQYNPSEAAQDALTGTLGIGGNAGFEIVDATTGSVTPQPYEVVIRAIARDTVTNELKLMVATSRFSNASSLLSTMAIDVFPIAGRPHAKELITPIYILETNSATSSIPVTITTTTLPTNSNVGVSMAEFKMQATGGTPNYSWFSDGLPPGLKMNTDGTISGTPTQLGSFMVNFAVMDSSSPAYIDETTITFTIPTNLTISTVTIPGAIVGTPYEDYTNASAPQPVTIQNTGGLAPYTWAIVAGSAPIGLTIDPGTGIISGVPCTYNSTTDFTKSFTFTVQVTDAIGAKASNNYTLTLSPAVLSFGLINQPTIIAGEQFKLSVPVYGGQSPYTLNSFSDSGIIGTGLSLISPTQISAVAGVVPSALSITTTDTTFYPASYPNNVALILSATGGVPSNAGLITAQSYKFYIDTTANNTLAGAAVYGPLLVATPTTDGVFQVTIKCIDSVGHIGSKILNITTQRQGSGQYTLRAYSVNTLGSTTPSNWVFTPLSSGFPDPVLNATYAPGANQYYCIVLLNNGTIQLSNGSNPHITASIIQGALPTNTAFVSGNTLATGGTGADCVTLIQGQPTSSGGASFEIQYSGISSPAQSTAQRFSLNVGAGGVGTPVVAVTFNPEIDLDLNTLVANANGAYSWAYPLIAEGGTGPYSFAIQTGTTLPSISTSVTIGNLPAFSSTTTTLNGTGVHYDVFVVATDKNGISSISTDIPIKIGKSTTQAVHILSNNIPSSVYINQQIPPNTYYVQSDLVANWTATGLPAGVTLSTAPSTRVYLSGTPTQVVGSTPITFTATSAIYGTTASVSVTFAVLAQTANIVSPAHSGATATIGTQYRVINNNAIVAVNYVGFQPGDPALPILHNSLSGVTLGSPTTTIGGQPSTGNSNVTATGFTMQYDYIPTVSGTDTLSFNSSSFPDSLTITEVYPTIVATGTSVPVTVSEYTVTQTFALPVTISGGNVPYTINVTGVSDSRFVAVSNGTSAAALQITVSQFASGSIYSCTVNMTVTDSSGNTATAVGTLSVTIQTQVTITVNFSNYTWNINSATDPSTGSIIMDSLMVNPQLGHAPYSYYVDSVTIPSGLGSFIQNSPTKRVLAFNLNDTSTPFSVADVDQTLTPSGTYSVTATSSGAKPSPGTYTIAVALRVVDSKGISASSTNNVVVVIS